MKTVGATLIAVIAGSLAATTVPAQAGRVLLQVLVSGADGQPLSGLTRDDFRVTTAGQPVAVESAEGGPSPAALVILFDISASLDGSYGPGPAPSVLRATINRLLAASPRSADRWRVASFARDLRMGSDLSADAGVLRASANAILNVPDADRYGPSPTWDAAEAGVTALEGERGRRSVVLVTDGRSTGNRHDLADVVRHAIAAGIPVSVVGPSGEERLSIGDSTALLVNSTLGLRALATDTGGGYHPGLRRHGVWPAGVMEVVSGPLQSIALETRLSYLVAITLPAGGSRPVQVAVTRPGAIVRAPAYVVSR